MEEYLETIDFPVKWDVGAPMPLLLANGLHTYLLFYLGDTHLERNKKDSVALVQFYRCVSARLGDPNDEVFHGHPLSEKGLLPYAAQIVRNSKWIIELETINKVHPQYNQEFWRSLSHYVLWFHNETFECVAKSYEVETFQKDMKEVFEEASKRMLL